MVVRWLDLAPFADSLCACKVKAELSVLLSQIQGVPEQARSPHVLPDLRARADGHHHLPRQVRVRGGLGCLGGWAARTRGAIAAARRVLQMHRLMPVSIAPGTL